MLLEGWGVLGKSGDGDLCCRRVRRLVAGFESVAYDVRLQTGPAKLVVQHVDLSVEPVNLAAPEIACVARQPSDNNGFHSGVVTRGFHDRSATFIPGEPFEVDGALPVERTLNRSGDSHGSTIVVGANRIGCTGVTEL